eukprot:PhF_6_TR43610/c0_g1_i1/m.66984
MMLSLISLGLTLLCLILHITAMATPSLLTQVYIVAPDPEIGLWNTCPRGAKTTSDCTLTTDFFSNQFPNCRQYLDHLRTAQSFSILFCFPTFILIVFLLDLVCGGIFGGLERRYPVFPTVMAICSVICELVTMSICSAIQTERLCNNANIYDTHKLSYGWSFFLLSFMFMFAVTFLVMKHWMASGAKV